MDDAWGQCLWLVHNGVDLNLAFSLDDTTRTAMAIKFSEFNGAKFNLSTMQFEEPDR